jgi:ABC-type oligopeptide transport system substrate-binding subunit
MGKRWTRIVGIALVSLVAWALAGCGQAAETPTAALASRTPPAASATPLSTMIPTAAVIATATATPAATAAPVATTAPTATATLAATATVAATATPTTAAPPVPPADYDTWTLYTQPDYGFSLRYPADWSLEEDLRPVSTSYRHALWLRPPAGGDAAVFTIGYKRIGEEAGIGRTGVGAGELVDRGTVTFLDGEIERQVLVAQGRDVTVMYRQEGGITRGDLLFTLDLDATPTAQGQGALAEATETTVDWIVRSFTLP